MFELIFIDITGLLVFWGYFVDLGEVMLAGRP